MLFILGMPKQQQRHQQQQEKFMLLVGIVLYKIINGMASSPTVHKVYTLHRRHVDVMTHYNTHTHTHTLEHDSINSTHIYSRSYYIFRIYYQFAGRFFFFSIFGTEMLLYDELFSSDLGWIFGFSHTHALTFCVVYVDLNFFYILLLLFVFFSFS